VPYDVNYEVLRLKRGFLKDMTYENNRAITATWQSNPPKIHAILTFGDPRNWNRDIQVIIDLLLSERGVYGTRSKKNGDASLPNCGYQQDDQPPLYFANGDLLWSNDFEHPRLGQGAFISALEGVWNALTGGAAAGVELKKTVIGKPTKITYQFAEDRFFEIRPRLQGKLKTIYMVGDNPESDIRGANEFVSERGIAWKSLLVETGVYQPGTTPAYKPTAIVEDQRAAVNYGAREAGWPTVSVHGSDIDEVPS
jgi:HAD superfamily hydrolase (TIGR01456 family)